ncbi:hypothetical protein FQN54_007099 [Arachnomyces sp. PD_36]|nr:hypothetical protein FQN54_007099 [Arachnomyces sp. PD_36]
MSSSTVKVVKVDGVYQVEGRPREEFEVLNVFHPPNLPGKSMIVVRVSLAPNGATPPHTHGGAAVIAIPVEGTLVNQMNSDEPTVSSPGEFWYEGPGCHHVRAENVSKTERAKFLAVLVVDDETIKDGFGGVFVLDAEKEEMENK